MKDKGKLRWMIGAALVFVALVWVGTPARSQNAADPAPGKQWLALMDKDNDGTVSKAEFNAYMDAQFDKADVDHDGTLDAKELEQLRKHLAIATKP